MAAYDAYNLNPIFYPKSLVVVGLSRRNFNHPGNTTFTKNLMEMKVKTYGVSPTSPEIDGHKIFAKIADLPEVPDLAVLCVSAKNTKQALIDAGEMGVRGAIIIGGGFAEKGKSGLQLQNEIIKIGENYNLPFIGPNCVGVYSPPIVDTIFLPSERIIKPKQGNVAVVSQSGGVLLDQFFLSCEERNIGISSAVSIGNKAMINETHLLSFFEKDPKTDVIAFYLEGFGKGEGRQFCEIARRSKKDIVVYTGGNTAAGREAANSHTASLAAKKGIMKGAFKQYSIIMPESELEVKNFLKVFSTLSNPYRRYTTMTLAGENIAVVSLSGGHGVICADLFEKYNLSLSKLRPEQKKELKFMINPVAANIAGLNNPIDLTGAAIEDDIINVLEFLLKQNNVQIILMLLLPYPPQISMHLGRKIMQISNKYFKPIITFVPWAEKYSLIRQSLEINYIPCAHTVEEAVMMISAICMKGIGGIRKKFNWKLNI
jgi:acyl-CoA synthetase (NDP forming)